VTHENEGLIDQPDHGKGLLLPARRLGQELLHYFFRRGQRRDALRGDELLENGRPLQDLPVEQAHVAAELIALDQRHKLLAQEQPQRLVAVHVGELAVVDQAEIVEGVHGRAQNLAIEPLLAAEMVVDGGLVGLGLVRDRSDRAALITLVGENGSGGLDQSVPGEVSRTRHYNPGIASTIEPPQDTTVLAILSPDGTKPGKETPSRRTRFSSAGTGADANAIGAGARSAGRRGGTTAAPGSEGVTQSPEHACASNVAFFGALVTGASCALLGLGEGTDHWAARAV
jgi:hypothetical protein